MEKELIIKKYEDHIAGTYARMPVVFERAEGARLYDTEDKEYIDFGSGIGVNAIGQCDGEWIEAVSGQAKKLGHVSNLYYSAPQAELAEKLCKVSNMEKVFFANSGAEANECAIKAARKYSFEKYGGERNGIISLLGSFHGRTVTTLAATGQTHFHNFFFPFTPGFKYSKTDFEAFKELCTDEVCAVIMECVQGEGGVLPLPDGFAQAVCEYARSRDILVIFDEVQAGLGRTGEPFGYMGCGGEPDIVTLAKGLGGGLPIGAALFSKKCAGVLAAGHHGSTFGGNPIVCAGANVVIDRITEKGFLEEVKAKGEKIISAIREKGSSAVKEIRGRGLMIGIALDEKTQAKELCERLLAAGLVTLTAGGNTLRLLPPLNISNDELDRGLMILLNLL